MKFIFLLNVRFFFVSYKMYCNRGKNKINIGELLHYSKTLKRKASTTRKNFTLNTILYTFVNNVFIKNSFLFTRASFLFLIRLFIYQLVIVIRFPRPVICYKVRTYLYECTQTMTKLMLKNEEGKSYCIQNNGHQRK